MAVLDHGSIVVAPFYALLFCLSRRFTVAEYEVGTSKKESSKEGKENLRSDWLYAKWQPASGLRREPQLRPLASSHDAERPPFSLDIGDRSQPQYNVKDLRVIRS